MTNLFDQLEQARSKPSAASHIRPEMSTTGFIHMKLEEEAPMFSKQKLNFAPPSRITHLVVCNNLVVLAMENQRLLRINLQQPDSLEEIEINKLPVSQQRLTGLFLDPFGEHLLLASVCEQPQPLPQLFYLNKRNTKVKQINKFRGLEVTAVAWNFNRGSAEGTGPILIGTSKGTIIETEIRVDDDRIFGHSLEQYFKQVFDLGRGKNISLKGTESNLSIMGLEFHQVPKPDNYFILVATLDRLYEFIGSVTNSEETPLLQQVFNRYLHKPEQYYTEPSKCSKLQLFYPKNCLEPNQFAWLVGQRLKWGELDLNLAEDTVLRDRDFVLLKPSPLSFIMTEFHALLMYSDHVRGVSLLNNETVFEDGYNQSFGKLVNITKDPLKGTIWAFSEKAVFKYKVTHEERNVWQIFVQKGEFDLAKQYCGNNPSYLDQVLVWQAETYFENKNYNESATLYAQTQTSFEEISLKFLQVQQINALKLFLKQKLGTLKPQEETQITMIVVWVLELILNQLGNLRDKRKENSREFLELQDEFDSLLHEKIVMDCIKRNSQQIYDLIASHGDKRNLVKLTRTFKDYEKVIRHHLYKGSYLEALEDLKSQEQKELFYEFAAPLMLAVPKQTVEALIAQGRALKPARLLPALIACDLRDHNSISEAIRYLEFCVRSLRAHDRAIHNYLLMLYAKFYPEKLKCYLDTEGEDFSMVHYDPHYALRLCREHKRTEACVKLSALLGLWESSVDLALSISVDMAKSIADKSHNDPELQKKLWLKIAKHVVSEKNDIQKAMEFLQACPSVKIEDILPFFSDFVTIDHFKDAICTSLRVYNQRIQDLKDDMEEASKSAELVRGEIHSFRNRFTVVRSADICQECSLQLLLRPFYLFPCGHSFHSDCLLSELLPALPPGKRSKLHNLQRQLASLTSREDTASLNSTSMSTREQLKADVDAIVAAECLYCGEMMIKSIDRPFVEEEDYDQIMKEWE